MSTQLAGWAYVVKPGKISVQRRETGDFRGVLGVSGEAEKGRFDGHRWT